MAKHRCTNEAPEQTNSALRPKPKRAGKGAALKKDSGVEPSPWGDGENNMSVLRARTMRKGIAARGEDTGRKKESYWGFRHKRTNIATANVAK